MCYYDHIMAIRDSHAENERESMPKRYFRAFLKSHKKDRMRPCV